MNKSHVIEHLKFALEAQLNSAKQAAKAAHDAATHEESVAETQYDTLGLEAVYLARGQAERVNDCYKSIKQFEAIFKEPTHKKVIISSHPTARWKLILSSEIKPLISVEMLPCLLYTSRAHET